LHGVRLFPPFVSLQRTNDDDDDIVSPAYN
jgi:hypothetical protein